MNGPARSLRTASTPAFAPGTGQRNRATGTPAPMHIVLFGAGHVGHALVTLLGALPCVVQWSTRATSCSRTNVRRTCSRSRPTRRRRSSTAPPGAYFLVMTHNHALDFSLAAQIMRRRDYAYFGMIGSRTKRVKFERRLAARGVDPARLVEMVCPIGVAGIVDKAPGAIAVAVCAELLQVRSGMPVADAKAAASGRAREDVSCAR